MSLFESYFHPIKEHAELVLTPRMSPSRILQTIPAPRATKSPFLQLAFFPYRHGSGIHHLYAHWPWSWCRLRWLRGEVSPEHDATDSVSPSKRASHRIAPSSTSASDLTSPSTFHPAPDSLNMPPLPSNPTASHIKQRNFTPQCQQLRPSVTVVVEPSRFLEHPHRYPSERNFSVPLHRPLSPTSGAYCLFLLHLQTNPGTS